MPKNWHHFSYKEHIAFLIEHGFVFVHGEGSHFFYVKRGDDGRDSIVQAIKGKEEPRQSRKTIDMSIRHSGIPKSEYKTWINR